MDAETLAHFNKLRATLGQAPLPVPGQAAAGPQFRASGDDHNGDSEGDDLSTLEKRAAAAGNNWEKLEKERAEKREREQRKEAAKKARDQAARNERLVGTGLGEANGAEEIDTRSWLLKSKKRQKEIEKARKVEEELAAREKLAEYTAKDLAGVKVAHQIDDFDGIDSEQILTLKDAEIGDESEDDELENTELKAKEKLEEKLQLKRKRPDYDPTEQGEKRNILYKYDEEIEGKQAKRFTLDGLGSSREAASRRRQEEQAVKPKTLQISLDMLQDETPVSDYVDPSTIKVKKPKKSKKEKKVRQKEADDEDALFPTTDRQPRAGDHMDMDPDHNSQVQSKRSFTEFDDDDLQAKLAEQRRQTLKKRKKTDAAELSRQLREQMAVDEEEPEDGGLVIDETTEFVANLQTTGLDDADGHRTPASRPVRSTEGHEDHDGDVQMSIDRSGAADDDSDRAVSQDREKSAPIDLPTTGLDEEETMMSRGLGATLKMLSQRGVLASGSADELAEKDRQRAEFLAAKQRIMDEFDAKAKREREENRRNGHYDNMSNKERDALQQRQNEARELYVNRRLHEQFNREYKPDIKLRYTDDYGREMNPKEAFKYMSHKFHGKGSGKQKTEKLLKKIDDEKKNMAKGILNIADSEGGMMNVQGREGKRQKTAGVRLQ